MKYFVIMIIRLYQAITRSAGSNPLWLSYSGCRSWPTCSDYAIQSIQQCGVVRGSIKSIVRVSHCHS